MFYEEKESFFIEERERAKYENIHNEDFEFMK